jgi:hypothetical protein
MAECRKRPGSADSPAAQANAESLSILSDDAVVRGYAVAVL